MIAVGNGPSPSGKKSIPESCKPSRLFSKKISEYSSSDKSGPTSAGCPLSLKISGNKSKTTIEATIIETITKKRFILSHPFRIAATLQARSG
jgi:hypothetical protein